MSNLPPLPVLCDTPPPIDDFSNIPDDDYVDFDGIADDYDVVLEDRPKIKFESEMEMKDLPEEDTPLPYLGNRSPPDGTDEMSLEFSGDNKRSLDLDSPPSLNLSDCKITTSDSDYMAKQVSSESVLENCDASTTTSQVHDIHHDRHIEGGENDETPCQLATMESTQEKTIKNLDDFTDFQSVPPDKDEENTDNLTFDVDFSNFKADFSELPPELPAMTSSHENKMTTELDDDAFDNFQDFSTVINPPPPIVDDDDDDFGDFNDFQTNAAPAPVSADVLHENPLPSMTLKTFTKIVDLMFPAANTSHVDEKATFDAMPFDNNAITSKLKDIEMSRALSYKYTNSSSSQTLMESIGIDAKNLFGMKWNPGMPRYAANLSFDPIQPMLQPTPVSAAASASKPTKTTETSVPVAQFDWSSAGLVNPLDGPSQIPSAKPIESPVIDAEKVSAIMPSTTMSSMMDEVSTTGTTHYSDSSYSFKSSDTPPESLQQTPLSPTYGMSVRTITLPETHIFTPEKCTNAISQSVDRNEVKEYHDVEYKLDKSLTSDCISSSSSVIGNNSISESVHSHFSLSQPVLAPSVVSTVSSIDPIVDGFTNKVTLKPSYVKKDNFPIFGTSPTDMGAKKGTDDDDFSDFQAAPVQTIPEPIKPKPISAMLLNPLPLSPVHLMQSAATLPEPDDDEMLRIEAFARSKSSVNNNDDDEWSDFTSATPPQPPTTNQTLNHKASHEDDWSDFVFTTPASSSMNPIIANHHRTTTQQKQNPAWNHQIFQQGNYMPWSTSTGSQSQPQSGMPELNFIQAQKSFVNAPNRMMRK